MLRANLSGVTLLDGRSLEALACGSWPLLTHLVASPQRTCAPPAMLRLLLDAREHLVVELVCATYSPDEWCDVLTCAGGRTSGALKLTSPNGLTDAGVTAFLAARAGVQGGSTSRLVVDNAGGVVGLTPFGVAALAAAGAVRGVEGGH